MKKMFKKMMFMLLVSTSSVVMVAQGSDPGFELSKNLEIFNQVYRNLHTTYVDDINPGELIKTALDAMLSKLDPYTEYYPEANMEDVKMQVLGKYGGIGAFVHQQAESIMIAEPYVDMPAHKAGLKAGDIILEVNDQSTKGKNVSEVTEWMRGLAGTTLNLKIQRKQSTFTKTLTREEIKRENVPFYGYLQFNDSATHSKRDTKIGYINLTEFTQEASKNVLQGFKALKDADPSMQGLVFDLRGNQGGLLQEAVHIVNFFVQQGEVIVRTKGKVSDRNESFRTMNPPIDLEIPIVVLIDQGSASASEIVSGALQDLDRAVIMGSRTFGKGLVQNIVPVAYGAQMKVTIAKYYIPSGRCVQAIDYSHRDAKGNPTKVPDSLKVPFTTKHGRVVYDGYGIEPDIQIPSIAVSPIAISLYSKFHIFNYAGVFEDRHPTIVPAKDFEITDEIYQDFVDYLKDKDYNYTTVSEKLMEQLEGKLKEEKYKDDLQSEIDRLKIELNQNKKNDLWKFQDEIKEMLKSEILARYYYQKGRIEGLLQGDPAITQAILLLENPDAYQAILKEKK